MRKLLLIGAILFISLPSLAQKAGDIQVLLFTGGHDFDREAFFGMLEEMDGFVFTEVKHPHANDFFLEEHASEFDVLLFYDMVQDISLEQKDGFENLVKKGIGLVFLHHALVSYQNWEYFKHVVGGRYHERGDQASNYKHDVQFNARVTEHSHPVIKGIADFMLYDEIYGNVEILKQVTPLLKTDHPQSMPLLAWAQEPSPKTRSVYIQPGHGPEVFSLKPFIQLLKQSMAWAAFR
jgi:uncharacterized protein